MRGTQENQEICEKEEKGEEAAVGKDLTGNAKSTIVERGAV